MSIVLSILYESYFLLNQMAPYLLFGFLCAGILHVCIKQEAIVCHLGKNNFTSVIKASLFGIPLPLCSCGVIPAALSLRREGESKSAVMAFLISTPTTGIDSIFATYALLGGLFTVYRIIADFVTAMVTGIFATLFLKEDKNIHEQEVQAPCKLCCSHHEEHRHSLFEKVKEIFRYAFVDLIRDSGWWLLIGILIGGILTYLLPDKFVQNYLGTGWKAMVVMLLVGIPMYVCATGSVPIAAALILKGMNPGAAFVFLVAGPATNTVTIAFVLKQLGIKALIIYLSSIAVCSIFFGVMLDHLWSRMGVGNLEHIMHHEAMLPSWIEMSASALLLLFIGNALIRKFFVTKKEKVV
jgi:uncharacterized protein